MPAGKTETLEVKSSPAEEMATTPSCIQALAGNREGSDYIISGTQGDFNSFERAIEEKGLQDQDRFFVPGNFIGSNPDSLTLIADYIKRNQPKQRLFVARGQNEQAVLDYLIALENFEKNNSEKNQLALKKAQVYCESLNLDWIKHFDKKSQLKTFLAKLPHVIHVEETKTTQPFFVVHKDLPFREQRKLRANLQQTLNQKQLDHCITGANLGYQKKIPVLSDHVVYCSNHPSSGVQLPGYRINVNIHTTDPDIDGAALRVNHTAGIVDIVAAEQIKYSALKANVMDLQAQIEMFLVCSNQLQIVSRLFKSIAREKTHFKPSSYAHFNQVKQCHIVPDEVNDSTSELYDPEFKLYCEKLNALLNLRRHIKDTINTPNATIEHLVSLMNDTIIHYAKTLNKKFNPPNEKLNEYFVRIFQVFIKHQYGEGRSTFSVFSQSEYYMEEIYGQLFNGTLSTAQQLTAYSIIKDLMKNIPSSGANFRRHAQLLNQNFIRELCQRCNKEAVSAFLETHFDLKPRIISNNSQQIRYYLPYVTPPVCIVEKGDYFYELRELNEQSSLRWIRNIIVANKNAHDPAVTNFVTHYFDANPSLLEGFLKDSKDEFSAHKIDVSEYIYQVPLFPRSSTQLFHYVETILFSNTAEKFKKKILQDNIQTQTEFDAFVVYCLSNQAIDLVRLQKKFSRLYEESLINPYLDNFIKLAEPNHMAEVLVQLPTPHLTIPLLSIYKDAILFPLDKEIIANYKIILRRCIESYKDKDFKGDFRKIKNAFNCLMNTSTDRLNELQHIYVQFISILNSKQSDHLKADDLKKLFLNSYKSIIHSRFGAGSRLGKALKGILKEEFGVTFVTCSVNFFSRKIDLPLVGEHVHSPTLRL